MLEEGERPQKGSLLKGVARAAGRRLVESAKTKLSQVAETAAGKAEGVAGRVIEKITSRKEEVQPIIEAAVSGLKEGGTGDLTSILVETAGAIIEKAKTILGSEKVEAIQAAIIAGAIKFAISAFREELKKEGLWNKDVEQELEGIEIEEAIREILSATRETAEETTTVQAGSAVKPPVEKKTDEGREERFKKIVEEAEKVREIREVIDIFRQLWEFGGDNRDQGLVLSKLRIRGVRFDVLSEGWSSYCGVARNEKELLKAREDLGFHPDAKNLQERVTQAEDKVESTRNRYQNWLNGITGEQKT